MSARILVVDDLPANVKLLEAKLTSEYYDVITANNGFKCIELARSDSPDIILLDVMMPDMDGFETCRRLKADKELSHIPVVMVTALSDVQDRVTGLVSGADDFLTKPINDHALFARIRSLVRLKQLMDELTLRGASDKQFGIASTGIDLDNEAITHGAKIVVVDDDIVQAKNIKERLSSLGAVVQLIETIDEVLPTLNRDDYDLAIVSTQLLDADGLRLCSQIRNNDHTRRIPILIMIEEDDTQMLVKGLDMGVNDYIVTPIDGNEVVARVRTQVRRKRYQDALKNNFQQSISMAVTDALTGLYNRHYFNTHGAALLDQAKKHDRPLSLMITDIDFFKKVNDQYGHISGDEVLKQVPKRMLECVRTTDLVARYGGEEFVVVMPDTELSDGKEIAERIRQFVEATPFTITAEPGILAKTMSFGVAMSRADDTLETLLKRADGALYRAKEGGRNQVVTE